MKTPTKKEIKLSAYDQSLKENIKKCFMSKTSTASQNNMGFLHKNIRWNIVFYIHNQYGIFLLIYN